MRQSKIEFGHFSCFLEKLNRAIIWIFLLKKLVEVEQMQPVSHLAVPLLQLMLSHPTNTPLVVSELLSCTSALFACVLIQPSALQPILQKMFAPLAVPNTENSKWVPAHQNYI